MKISMLAAAGLLGFGLHQVALAQTLDGRVVGVGDGDTVRAKVDGETLTVRLACIDAAEMAQQPWGEDARRRLSELLPPSSPVKLRVADVDRYGRTVAEVFVGGHSANLQMVEEGQAVVYTQYLSACSDSRDEYLRAEEAARQARSGYWSQSDPIMPWEFRRGRRNTSAAAQQEPPSQQVLASGCDPSYPDVCIPPSPPDLDCGEISHRRFRVLPPDPHRFDGDRDGIGCER
ncbi:MAG: thermonuclease family protein [Synechococcus sp.]